MPLINLQKILAPAYQQGYAVGAFNVVNFEFLEAIIVAATAKRSPVILNIAEVHFPYVNLETICPVIKQIAANADIPIALNLDHCLNFNSAVRALQNGFSSIMFDGSKLAYEENVRQTQEIVKMCHAVDVSVEAELGQVGGAEGGGLVGSANAQYFTDPLMAVDFVKQTNVDALAVAIGNAHGFYQGDPQLDFARLQTINEKIARPLVLHGGSGISAKDFKKAIALGIAKINFFTGMASAAMSATNKYLQEAGKLYNDYPEMQRQVKQAVIEVVAAQMEIFGSVNKA